MITEFFGLPGSGKTYLANKFAKEHGLPIIEVHNRAATYLWALIFAFTHPRIFFFFLQKMAHENGKDVITAFFLSNLFRYKVHHLYLRVIAKEGKSLWRKNAVIDEGLSQLLLYLFERKIGEDEIFLPSPVFRGRVVHIVLAGFDARMARMQNRGRIPRAFLNKAYKGEWFSIGYGSLKKYNEGWLSELEHNFRVVAKQIKNALPYKEIFNE